MNNTILTGRLTRDPEVRYSQGPNGQFCVAKYTLAVERTKEITDFINCEALGKNGEFAEKYLHKGTKILVRGSIQTGSYTNKEGVKVYTTTVNVNHHEFMEGKSSSSDSTDSNSDEFLNVPDDFNDFPID